MECPSCGAEIQEDDDYCSECGKFVGEKKVIFDVSGLSFKLDAVMLMNIVLWTVIFSALMFLSIGNLGPISDYLRNNSVMIWLISIAGLIPLNFYIYRIRHSEPINEEK